MRDNFIDILIINYNSHDILEKCIQSINETDISYKIHILNNDTEVKLTDKINNENLQIYEPGENLGFAGGVNFLVRRIRSNYFLLLNPDATLSKNLISSLFHTIKKDTKIAAISPLIYDNKKRIWFNYGKIDWDKNKIINVNNNLNYDTFEVDTFNGCVALLRKDLFLKAGGFNKELFMYYDEAFLSVKLKNLGYKILLNKSVCANHNVSYSTRKNGSVKVFYITRNGFAFFIKYNPNKSHVFFNYLIRGLYYVKHFDINSFMLYYKALISTPFLLKKIK